MIDRENVKPAVIYNCDCVLANGALYKQTDTGIVFISDTINVCSICMLVRKFVGSIEHGELSNTEDTQIWLDDNGRRLLDMLKRTSDIQIAELDDNPDVIANVYLGSFVSYDPMGAVDVYLRIVDSAAMLKDKLKPECSAPEVSVSLCSVHIYERMDYSPRIIGETIRYLDRNDTFELKDLIKITEYSEYAMHLIKGVDKC